MNKPLVTILLFVGLLLFVTSPFAALASLMLGLIVTAFLWTGWTLMQTLISGAPKRDSQQ